MLHQRVGPTCVRQLPGLDQVPDDGKTHRADIANRGAVVQMRRFLADQKDRRHEEHNSSALSGIRQQAGTRI